MNILKKLPVNRVLIESDRLLLYEDTITNNQSSADILNKLRCAEERVSESYLNIVENHPPKEWEDIWHLVYECGKLDSILLQKKDSLCTKNLSKNLLPKDFTIGDLVGEGPRFSLNNTYIPNIKLPRGVVVYAPHLMPTMISESVSLCPSYILDLGNIVSQLRESLIDYIEVYYEYWKLGLEYYSPVEKHINSMLAGEVLFLKDINTWGDLLNFESTRDLFFRLVELRSEEIKDEWNINIPDKFKMSHNITNLLRDDFSTN